MVSSLARSDLSRTFIGNPRLSPPLPQVATDLVHVLLLLPFMNLSHKWGDHLICGLLGLALFTEHNIFEVHSYRSMCPQFVPFFVVGE